MRQISIIITLISIVTIFNQCKKESSGNEIFEFKDKLSELHIYEGNMMDLSVVDGFLPYDLTSPLFSDYAQKLRFVKIPAGKQLDYIPNRVFDFPDGSILVKNFFYYNDERNTALGRRIIETRILAKKDGIWGVGVYLWNDAQDEAVLKPLGATVPNTWINAQGQTVNMNLRFK